MQFLILFLRCHTRETTARGFPRTAVQVSHEFNLFQVRIIIKRDATPLADLDYMRAHDQSQGSTPPFFSFGEMAIRQPAPVSDFVVRRLYRASSPIYRDIGGPNLPRSGVLPQNVILRSAGGRRRISFCGIASFHQSNETPRYARGDSMLSAPRDFEVKPRNGGRDSFVPRM